MRSSPSETGFEQASWGFDLLESETPLWRAQNGVPARLERAGYPPCPLPNTRRNQTPPRERRQRRRLGVEGMADKNAALQVALSRDLALSSDRPA
jgi:hypothetical protein